MSTLSRDYEFGRIVSVDVVTFGDNLAADAASGASSITVEDAADFDEGGGSLLLNGVAYTYTSCDDDTGVITLSGTLSGAAVEGDAVEVWDTQYLAVATEKVAQVAVIGDDGSVDMLEAAIALHLVDKVQEGIRGNVGEAVKLELDGGEWVVVDISGLGDPNSAGGLFYEDSLTVTATGVQTLNLTYEPRPHSEHLYWNGVYQPGSEWSRVGQVVTVPDSPTGAVEVGDQLVMEYAYLKGIFAPPIAGVPYATEVLADTPEFWARLGETGDYAAGPVGVNNIGTNPIALNAISLATPNNSFDMEVGEPYPTGIVSGKTGWWSFTVPVDQEVRVDTQLTYVGGNADTEIAVRDMTGGGWGTVVAASGDDGGNNTSLLTFAATTGVIYAVQVGAYNSNIMEYVLRVTGNHLADSSGNARHGNYTSGGIYYLTRGVTGLLSDDSNKAAQFVASQACRGLVPYASWMTQSALTVEAIIESTQTDGVIVCRGVTGTQSWLLNLTGGKLRFTRFGSVNSQATTTASFNDGQRHHVVATYDATNGTLLYVDGALVATSAPATSPSTTTEPLTIASDNTTPGGGTMYEGILDEVAFYGTALSASRVLAHYSAMVGG